MKTIISIMIITLGVIFFFFGGNESNEASVDVNQAVTVDSITEKVPTPNKASEASPKQDKKPVVHSDNKYAQSNSSRNDDSSSYGDNYSSNNNRSPSDQDSSYNANGSSYWQDNATYNDNSYTQTKSNNASIGSSYDQGTTGSSNRNESTTSNNSGLNSQNDSTESDKTDTADNAKPAEEASEAEEAKTPEDLEGLKYQRIYDSGIVWSGDTGLLTVEYQSSNPETTGIGFRLHYDSLAIRVISVNQYPVDAITSTSAKSQNPDGDNRDNDEATDYFLPFAWASIYGQWPQMSQTTLATVEFEKAYGNSSNYKVNYSPISVSAGYQFIQ